MKCGWSGSAHMAAHQAYGIRFTGTVPLLPSGLERTSGSSEAPCKVSNVKVPWVSCTLYRWIQGTHVLTASSANQHQVSYQSSKAAKSAPYPAALKILPGLIGLAGSVDPKLHSTYTKICNMEAGCRQCVIPSGPGPQSFSTAFMMDQRPDSGLSLHSGFSTRP